MVCEKTPRHRSSVRRSTSSLRLSTPPSNFVHGHCFLHSCSSRRTEVDALRTAWIAARRVAYAYVARASILVAVQPRSRPTNHHVDVSAHSLSPPHHTTHTFQFLLFFLLGVVLFRFPSRFPSIDGWWDGIWGFSLSDSDGKEGQTRSMVTTTMRISIPPREGNRWDPTHETTLPNIRKRKRFESLPRNPKDQRPLDIGGIRNNSRMEGR